MRMGIQRCVILMELAKLLMLGAAFQFTLLSGPAPAFDLSEKKPDKDKGPYNPADEEPQDESQDEEDCSGNSNQNSSGEQCDDDDDCPKTEEGEPMATVDVYDGRLHHDVVDLSFAARDKILGPFQVKRSYLSGEPSVGGHFGTGWTWDFDLRANDLNGDASTFGVGVPGGSFASYVKSGSYAAADPAPIDGFYMEELPDGSAELRRQVMRGRIYHFRVPPYHFSGPLTSIESYQGLSYTVEYDSDYDFPIKIYDNWNRELVITKIEIANRSLISRIDAYEGGTNCGHMEYGYDSLGRLTSAIDAEDNETQYEYVESTSYLHRIITPEERSETFSYDFDEESDSYKRCTAIDHMGETDRWFISYEYHPTEGRAVLKYYAIPLLGQGPLRTKELTWSTSPDMSHSILSKNDSNGQWTYEYNDNGRLTRKAEVSGDVVNKEFFYEYNATGLRSAVVNPRGFRTQFQYFSLPNPEQPDDPYQKILASETRDAGGLNYTQTWQHDAVGNSTSVSWYDGSGELARQIRYEFGPTAAFPDNCTLMTKMIQNPDLLGGGADQVTRLEYDQYGNMTKLIDSLLRETKYTYQNGDVTVVEDPLGRATTFSYDEVHRLTSVQLPRPSPGAEAAVTPSFWTVG